MAQCPWKIHYGVTQEATSECGKGGHLPADPVHEGPGLVTGQTITWYAGDRREYTGEWPGPCPAQPCILHAGHHGGHAP